MQGDKRAIATRRVMDVALFATVYIAAAFLSRALSLYEKSLPADIWLASGLGLAVVLAQGWWLGFGLLNGAIIFSALTLEGQPATRLFVGTILAVSFLFQSFSGTWLFRRLLKTAMPANAREIFIATGILAFIALLPAAMGSATLCEAGIQSWSKFWQLFLRWWLEAFTGMLLVSPASIFLIDRLHGAARKDFLAWTLGSAILGVGFILFAAIGDIDRRALQERFTSESREMIQVLRNELHGALQNLVSLESFFASSRSVEPEEFKVFASRVLAQNADILSLMWVPAISGRERAAYERRITKETGSRFALYERDAQGNPIPASLERDEYFPIEMIESAVVKRESRGFDFGADFNCVKALNAARESGTMTMAIPLLPQGAFSESATVLVYVPVYSGGFVPSVEERRVRTFRGCVVGWYDISLLVRNAMSPVTHHDIELFVYPGGKGTYKGLMGFSPSLSGEQTYVESRVNRLALLAADPSLVEPLEVGEDYFLAIARPGPAYMTFTTRWLAWGLLLVCAAISAALLVFLSLQHKVKAALEHSEAEFRAISDNALTGIMRFVLGGEVRYVNLAAARLFGYESVEAFISKPLNPNALKPHLFEKILRDLKATGKIDHLELNIVAGRAAGKTILCSATLFEGIVNANLVDMTERIRAEAVIKENNERFEQLAATLQDGFWINDLITRKFEFIGSAYEKIWGISARRFNEHPDLFMKSILPEDREIIHAAMKRNPFFETTDCDYRIKDTAGRIHYIWDRSFPILGASGEVVKRTGVCSDITELKKTQESLEELNRELERRVEERARALNEREALYRGLFENSNDAIFLLSPEGKGLRANQKALDLFGLSEEEYLAMSASELEEMTPKALQPDLHERVARLLRGEEVPPYERVFIGRNGKRTETEINLSLVRDRSGQGFVIQSVVRDITERKKVAERLRQSLDELSAANVALEKASRMKDEFLASMSHELRTPLTGILGLSEALQLQTFGSLSERQAKALRNIEESGHHLLDLINDILDLSKIEAGKFDLHPETCDAAAICQASLQLTKGLAHLKRQIVDFHIDPETIELKADPRRLKQMIVNLLGNAIKFTPEEGSLGLEVIGDRASRTVEFRVWDKGIGIASEDMGKLFKPFSQINGGLARQYTGTGLGLSLVKRMAELHGGDVKVESEPGKGSRFSLVLPWEPTAGG